MSAARSTHSTPRGKTSPCTSITMPWAIEVFARGFSFTRSFTHPYIAEPIEGLWVLRDGPRRHGDYRNEEWIAWNVSPSDAHLIIRKHTHGRYAVCAMSTISENDAPLRAAYKQLGYRLRTTEPLMIHNLSRIPRFDSPARIERVMTPELADRLAQVARSRQILPEHLTKNAPLRQYVALLDGVIVGWVRSITTHLTAGTSATWCSNMHVAPSFRRRGIARAMLSRMLRDDRHAGAQAAVLLASHTGAKLYPVVGYRQTGTLLLFSPRR